MTAPLKSLGDHGNILIYQYTLFVNANDFKILKIKLLQSKFGGGGGGSNNAQVVKVCIVFSISNQFQSHSILFEFLSKV